MPLEFASVGCFFILQCVCGRMCVGVLCGSSFLSFFLQDIRMFEMNSSTYPAKLAIHWLFSIVRAVILDEEHFLLAGSPFLYSFSSSQGCFIDAFVILHVFIHV